MIVAEQGKRQLLEDPDHQVIRAKHLHRDNYHGDRRDQQQRREARYEQIDRCSDGPNVGAGINRVGDAQQHDGAQN